MRQVIGSAVQRIVFRTFRPVFGITSACAILVLVVLLASALPISATTHTVTTTADSLSPSPGDLRYEIANAGSGDTINFSVSGTITLVASLTIATDITITGPGAANLAIDGASTYTVFVVNSSATVSISGLTIQNGKTNANFAQYSGGGSPTAGV